MFKDLILFRTFFILGILFGSILVLTIYLDFQRRRKQAVKGLGELWLRYISFLFIAPVFLSFAYIGRPFFNFLVMIMAALYLSEFFHLTNIWQHNIYRWEGRIFGLLILLGTLHEDKFIFFRIPLLVTMCVMATPVFLRRIEDSVRQTALTIEGILYFGWMFSYIIFLRDNFGFGGVVFVCFLVTIDDLAAFWVGKLFGKRKLIPQISPNKTVEGALGGLFFTVLFSFLLRYALPGYSYLKCAILGLIISFTGQIGDLVISVIKRDMGVKDSGRLLPGHGGMLDRFDSWIFTLPIAYYVLFMLK